MFCSKCFKELAEKALHLLNINTDRLKTKNNVADFYLPIGEKEKRCDRYEVKPIYEYGDMIIYSPVAVHFLRDYWQNSIFEFHMPFEIGMPSTKGFDWLEKGLWKENCFDLEKVFKDYGFEVRANFELMNLDKKKYPQFLGDYDLFAVDLQKKKYGLLSVNLLRKLRHFMKCIGSRIGF